MTEQTDGFRPDAAFAVIAQQEEINRLRAENAALSDRLIWQRAVNLQMQAEANATIESLTAALDESRESHKAEAEVTVPGAQQRDVSQDGAFVNDLPHDEG